MNEGSLKLSGKYIFTQAKLIAKDENFSGRETIFFLQQTIRCLQNWYEDLVRENAAPEQTGGELASDELNRLRLMRYAVESLYKEMNNDGGIHPYWLRAVDDVIGIANGESLEVSKQTSQLRPDGAQECAPIAGHPPL